MGSVQQARRGLTRAVRAAVITALVVVLAALLVPLPTEQRVLYLTGAVLLLALAALGLLQLCITPSDIEKEPRQ